MGSSGGSKTTVQQDNDPWSGVKPYLRDLYSQGQGLYSGSYGYNPYPGTTVAGFSPYQQQGMSAMAQNLASGNTAGQAAEGMLGSTLSGGYLGQGNPYLNQYYQAGAQQLTDQFNQQVMPAVKSQGQSQGMYNSSREGIAEGLAAQGLTQSLGDLATNIYYPAYEAERTNQMQAAMLAPSLSNYGAQQMYNLGSLEQQQLQNELNANQQYWTQAESSPWDRLASYANIIYGSPQYSNSTQTTSTDTGSGLGSTLLSGLGGAATGAGLWGTLAAPSALGASTMAPWLLPLTIGGGLAGLF